MKVTIACVTIAKRIACTAVALALIWAIPVSRRPAGVDRRGGATHGGETGGPHSKGATIEAAVVVYTGHQALAAPGVTSRSFEDAKPSAREGGVRSGFGFPRPHDPPHLHAFSLLI